MIQRFLASLGFKVAAIVGAAGLLIWGAGFLVHEVRGVFNDGREMERALWQAELARKEAEAQARIIEARDAGRAEAAKETAKAETRATAAENALRRARNEQPDFDAALRAEWPDAYFDSVCLGRGADCAPPDPVDQ